MLKVVRPAGQIVKNILALHRLFEARWGTSKPWRGSAGAGCRSCFKHRSVVLMGVQEINTHIVISVPKHPVVVRWSDPEIL